jgi:transposase-like protein
MIPELQNIDIRVELIQALTPMNLLNAQTAMEDEVTQLVGNKYQRGSNYYRWGRQGGSIYLGEQKFPVVVPRVRNKNGEGEVKLKTYEKLKKPRKLDEGILCVMDGSKGLIERIKKAFGKEAIKKRCHWHKRECNELSFQEEARYI